MRSGRRCGRACLPVPNRFGISSPTDATWSPSSCHSWLIRPPRTSWKGKRGLVCLVAKRRHSHLLTDSDAHDDTAARVPLSVDYIADSFSPPSHSSKPTEAVTDSRNIASCRLHGSTVGNAAHPSTAAPTRATAAGPADRRPTVNARTDKLRRKQSPRPNLLTRSPRRVKRARRRALPGSVPLPQSKRRRKLAQGCAGTRATKVAWLAARGVHR